MFSLFAQAVDVVPQYSAAQPWPVEPPMVDAAVIPATVVPSAVATAPAAPSDVFHDLLGHLTTLDANGWEYAAYQLGLRAVFVLILLTVAWTISGWGSAIVRTTLDRIKFDETLSIFLSKLVRYAILLMAALTCLNKFGVETTSFAALIGAAGLAIGLAFQGTLSNFAAGAMLLLFRPYKVGDEVNVAGYSGTVREIELFTTAIDTPDYRRIIVPNSSIFGAVIENVTHHPVRRFNVDVGTAYSADIDQTRRVLERAVSSVTQVVPTPAPAVVLLDLGASSVNWSVRAWAKRETHGDARQALVRAVKMELDQAGIGIPFPQLDLHLDPPEAEGARLAA
jgi:small conductance mechanosensitive channel